MNLSLNSLDRICLFIVIIVAVISGLLVVKHSTKQQAQVRLENSLYFRSSNKMQQAESSLQHLKTAVKATQGELKVLKERIPESAEIGKFLKQLDSRIKRRKIALITLQPLPEKPASYFTKIPIRLIFKGAFIDVYNLLRDLETMNRVLITETLTISKAGIGEQCRVDLTINVFEY